MLKGVALGRIAFNTAFRLPEGNSRARARLILRCAATTAANFEAAIGLALGLVNSLPEAETLC